MTTNFDVHPHNGYGSCSFLHGVHGGNDKRGLKGWFCTRWCFSFSFVFLFSDSIATAFTRSLPKEEGFFFLRENLKDSCKFRGGEGFIMGLGKGVEFLAPLFCCFWSSFFYLTHKWRIVSIFVHTPIGAVVISWSCAFCLSLWVEGCCWVPMKRRS